VFFTLLSVNNNGNRKELKIHSTQYEIQMYVVSP